MPFEEYARLSHPIPYVLTARHGRGALLYIGAEHTFDPQHAEIREIEERWREFRPTLAFNEGGDPPAEDSASEAVRRHGEPGLIRHLAARDGVRVRSIEPSETHQFAAAVEAGFAPEEVKLYLVLRAYKTFRESRADEPSEAFISRALRHYGAIEKLAGSPRTPEDLADLYARLFPDNPDWRAVPDWYFAPTGTETILNRIARRVARARDRHMVEVLAKATQAGERVFAVVGFGHVAMQEPALRARLRGLRRVETICVSMRRPQSTSRPSN